jgi:plastocyanin
MPKSILPICALVAITLAFSACAGDSEVSTTTSSAPSDNSDETDSATITIENFAFGGATSVPVGTTVIATNEDGVTHTWTSSDGVWESGGIASGESFEFTFEEAGEYSYFCTIHPTMEGTITVEG